MAKDYGLRISEEGYDVKTCDDKKCVVTSKYPLLKGSLEASVYGSDDDNGNENWAFSIEINHNLGFIPVVRIFILTDDGYMEIPETEWQAGVYIYDTYYEHTSINKITIYASLWVSGGDPGLTLEGTYHYYISNERVNI